MKHLKIAAALLTMGLATSAFAIDGEFGLKGNVQTQVTKSIADEDHNFSSGWIRANVGGQYKSENLDGLIMLRIFAPEFGNKIDGKMYDNRFTKHYIHLVNHKFRFKLCKPFFHNRLNCNPDRQKYKFQRPVSQSKSSGKRRHIHLQRKPDTYSQRSRCTNLIRNNQRFKCNFIQRQHKSNRSC